MFFVGLAVGIIVGMFIVLFIVSYELKRLNEWIRNH